MKQKYWTQVDEKEPILDLKEHFKTQIETGEWDDAFTDWLGDTETANGIYDFFEHLVYMRGNLKSFYDDSVNDFAEWCKGKLDEAMEGDDTYCSIYGRIYKVIEVDI